MLCVVCYISGSMCRKSNAVWSRLLILFDLFLYWKINRRLQLQKRRALWAWFIQEKKQTKEKQSYDTVVAGRKHLCEQLRSKPFSRHWRKKKKRKEKILMFQQTLEIHVIALNFYDTCHNFMDKWNDGCPRKKGKRRFFTGVGKQSIRKWLIVL